MSNTCRRHAEVSFVVSRGIKWHTASPYAEDQLLYNSEVADNSPAIQGSRLIPL